MNSTSDTTRHAETEAEDKLAPARGVLHGVLAAVGFDFLLAALYLGAILAVAHYWH